MKRSVISIAFLLLLSCCTMLMVGGCAIFGYAASAIPESADAKYAGLKGQRVAVMVWVDRGIRLDYATLQLDLASFIQAKLIAEVKDRDELKDSQWPWEAKSVLRFQKEHPDIDGRSVTEYAHRISGITRLIYVEVDRFSTRGDETVQLLRGKISGRMKVVEINNGKSKVAYEKSDLAVLFPKKQSEGVINVPEYAIYGETLKAFGTQVAELFYGHIIEESK